VLLFACASALGAGLSYNPALTAAPRTNSDISEATKDTLLNTAHLPGAITAGASSRLATRLAADALTQGAMLSAQNIYLLLATERCFLKGDTDIIVKVSTALWCLAGSRSYSAKEGIKDIAKTAEVKALKAPSEKPFGTTMPKTVIGGAFIRIREHFVSLIYLFKFFPGGIIVVMVRVIFKG
jgi:hypothetical protein